MIQKYALVHISTLAIMLIFLILSNDDARYRRELKRLSRIIRFSRSALDKSKVTAVKRRLKTIANAQLRDITHKLPEERRNILLEQLKIYRKVIN